MAHCRRPTQIPARLETLGQGWGHPWVGGGGSCSARRGWHWPRGSAGSAGLATPAGAASRSCCAVSPALRRRRQPTPRPPRPTPLPPDSTSAKSQLPGQIIDSEHHLCISQIVPIPNQIQIQIFSACGIFRRPRKVGCSSCFPLGRRPPAQDFSTMRSTASSGRPTAPVATRQCMR